MFKKIIIIILFAAFAGLTVFVGLRLLPQVANSSALQVIVNGGPAHIYLNNQKLGETPYENEKMHPGEYELKIIPENKKMIFWSSKITLTTGAMTTIERNFSLDGKRDGGLMIYLEAVDTKTAQVEIITAPDDAQVYLNKEDKGTTPLIVRDLAFGQQEVIIKKDGFEDRIQKIDTVSGYKAVMIFDLIPEKKVIKKAVPTQSKTLGATATESAKTVSITPTVTGVKKNLIEIVETGTGWLRVRMEPSTESTEAAKVNVKDQFTSLDQQNGWIKIEYQTGKFGWISADFVKKIN